jgi:hypothetical protein
MKLRVLVVGYQTTRRHKSEGTVNHLCSKSPRIWYTNNTVFVGRNSSVGTATRYGPDGPGIESSLGDIFLIRPDWPWGPPSLLYSGYRVSFPGLKHPVHFFNYSPPSSAEVKERVELYHYSLSGPSRPVLGRTFNTYVYVFVRSVTGCSSVTVFWQF